MTTITVNGTRLNVDPWAANPLVDGWKDRNPALVQIASSEAPTPTLFETGDLPPFTASGIDPHFLTYVPFGCRHHAATEPDASAVLTLIETSCKDPYASVDSDGLNAYIARVSNWLSGVDVPADKRSQDDEQALYDSVFGATEAALNDQLAKQQAFADQFNAQRNPFAAGDSSRQEWVAGRTGYGVRMPGGQR